MFMRKEEYRCKTVLRTFNRLNEIVSKNALIKVDLHKRNLFAVVFR